MKERREREAALTEEPEAPRSQVEELDKSRAGREGARMELREGEERCRTLSERAVDAIFILDGEGEEPGQVVSANRAAAEMHGYAAAELLALNIEALYAPDAAREAPDLMRRVLEGEWVKVRTTHRRKDGTVFPVETRAGLLELGGHKYIVAFDRDIAERKRAEEALRRSEEKYRDLVENINEVIYTTDESGTVTYVSPVVKSLLGYSPSEIIGRAFTEFVLEEDRPRITASFQSVFSGLIEISENRFLTMSGEIRWVQISGRPILLEDCVIGVRGMLTDITERKQAEKALRESEERLAGIYNSSKVSIGFVNMDGTILEVNDSFCKLTGYSKDELLAGKRYQEITPQEYQEYEARIVESIIATGEPAEYEKEFTRKDGSRFPVLLTIFAVKGDDGNPVGLAAIIKDITERKRVEQQLQVYQGQLRSLASQLSLAEERERRRIAVELHDCVGPRLSIANMRLEDLQASMPSLLGAEVGEIRELIVQTIGDTRSLTFELSPPVLYELGLEAAVSWLAEQVEKQHGIETGVEADEQPKPLEDDIRVLLFRTVRELLVNVAKHAQARHAKVSIAREDNFIRIVVEDDGVGFYSDDIYSRMGETKSCGLFSIRERLIHLGGCFEVKSTPDHGTRAVVRAPLRRDGENSGGK